MLYDLPIGSICYNHGLVSSNVCLVSLVIDISYGYQV